MKLPVIKKLVEQYELADLKAAEEALMNEENPAIEVEGDDEGEQLTHILAAIWSKEYMAATGADFRTAQREYTKKVRVSIS
jgi:hypothetical protein